MEPESVTELSRKLHRDCTDEECVVANALLQTDRDYLAAYAGAVCDQVYEVSLKEEVKV